MKLHDYLKDKGSVLLVNAGRIVFSVPVSETVCRPYR